MPRGARSFRRPRFPEAVQQELEPAQKRRVVANACPYGAVTGDGIGRVECETHLQCGMRLVKSIKMREGRLNWTRAAGPSEAGS
jgi:hypothetical protein